MSQQNDVRMCWTILIVSLLWMSGCSHRSHSAVIGEQGPAMAALDVGVGIPPSKPKPIAEIAKEREEVLIKKLPPEEKLMVPHPPVPRLPEAEAREELAPREPSIGRAEIFARPTEPEVRELAPGMPEREVPFEEKVPEALRPVEPLAKLEPGVMPVPEKAPIRRPELKEEAPEAFQPVEPLAKLEPEFFPLGEKAPAPTLPEPKVREREEVAAVGQALMPEAPGVLPTPALKEISMSDIYFDYDRFYIRPDAKPVLEANAKMLQSDVGQKRVLIEGHCDERGTEEYNMVLGDRRALATKRYLLDLGVDGTLLETVSYGKEKPVCTDSHPVCWQQNRRSHFVLR